MKRGILSTYTGKIILINVVVFILSFIMISIWGADLVYKNLAIQPIAFFSGQFWTIITSMFMHSGFMHLFANMISLFFVGMFVEQLIGKKRFIIFYFIAGIFAALFYVSLSFLFGNSVIGTRLFGSPETLALGASGAIFGVLGLLAVLTPRNKVYMIAGPLIAIIIEVLLSSIIKSAQILNLIEIIITVYFVFAIFSMISFNPRTRRWAVPIEMPFWILPIVAIVPLVIIGLFVVLPIGNTAHLGGLIAGLVYGFYLRKKYPKKTKMIAKYFSR